MAASTLLFSSKYDEAVACVFQPITFITTLSKTLRKWGSF